MGRLATPFNVTKAAGLAEKSPDQRWLIESLWPASAVGLVGGHPKSCKSWLGLELAVAVATGTSCLDRFAVRQPGRVLVYMAEDDFPVVRERIASLAAHRKRDLENLDVHVITEPVMRLDAEQDMDRLDATLAFIRPRLLLLDPLVRLHSGDENSVVDIAALLGGLRVLQRKHDVAIALVHHARKNGNGARHGQSLRGSSDIFAWADVLHYLDWRQNGLRLSVEHRSAAALEPMLLALDKTSLHLHIIDDDSTTEPALQERILHTLKRAQAPLRREELRKLLAVNNDRLGKTLVSLENSGRIRRTPKGWHC